MHANQFWVTDSGTPISEVDTFQKYAGGVSCGVGDGAICRGGLLATPRRSCRQAMAGRSDPHVQ
jgi:hypothetical protein